MSTVSGQQMTAAEAQAAIEEKMRDKKFAKKFSKGDAKTVGEMTRLHEIAAGGAVTGVAAPPPGSKWSGR